jgi:predicted alpha/beta superfamily hydrolase
MLEPLMPSRPRRIRAWGAATLLALSAGSAAAEVPAPHTASSAAAPASEEAGRPIVIGRSFELPSKILGDTRRINVYLPDGYGTSGRSFPVLYLLDGGEKEDFLHIAGLAQITAAYGEGQEMIVVGIAGVDRRHDLTSPSDVAEDRAKVPTAGGAATYRRFLIQELQPWVAARYRTNGRSALMGESLAGLFVLETLLSSPGAFSDYIAVSPSIWWNGGKLAAGAAQTLRGLRFSGQRLWLTFDVPPPPPEQAEKDRARQHALEKAFQTTKPPGLRWTVTYSVQGHSSVYHPAALEAFRALYALPPR